MKLLLCLCLLTATARADDFTDFCRANGDTTTVTGLDGWLFLGRELHHLSTPLPWTPDPMPAILDFNTQLKAAGIELLVMPVPAKTLIYPDKLKSGLTVPPLDRQFEATLRQQGVNVVDITDDLLAHRVDQMYCKTDSHWSGQACMVAAQRLADLIKDRPWPKQEFKTETRKTEITGDLGGSETLPLRYVTGPDGQLVEPNRDSPVILLGDSHCLVFHAGDDMLARGAGLADQLAVELGTPVDLIAVRGSGATPARVNLMRRIRSAPDYLSKKKLVIWCFSVREFTESSGWSKVPLTKP